MSSSSPRIQVEDVEGRDLALDEVESLASGLDSLKSRAESVAAAHKHAVNKKVHDEGFGYLDSYDPDVSTVFQFC